MTSLRAVELVRLLRQHKPIAVISRRAEKPRWSCAMFPTQCSAATLWVTLFSRRAMWRVSYRGGP